MAEDCRPRRRLNAKLREMKRVSHLDNIEESEEELRLTRTGQHEQYSSAAADEEEAGVWSAESPATNNVLPPKKRQRASEELELGDDGGAPPQTKAQKMMLKMGFRQGGGLGKQEQGMRQPIKESTQRGRLGLGFGVGKELELDASAEWDDSKEQLTVVEEVRWIREVDSTNNELPLLTKDYFHDWMKEGPICREMREQTDFCSVEVLTSMLKSKTIFDQLTQRELNEARQRANPYETVGKGIFQNRAAMKMANMDAVFDWLFTNPKTPRQCSSGDPDKPWVSDKWMEEELFYFSDVCAGPGGFTEYVLWRRGYSAHGLGFTLAGKDDFKLDKFFSASPEMFETYYGVDKSGDVTKPDNLADYRTNILQVTQQKLCHLVMADGGFSVEGRENIQEILSKRIYLCQFICALLALRIGGNFVCKLFDVFTRFSVGLIYLMYRVFDQVCIHKPKTSRPANSERYLICKGLREGFEPVLDYLINVNGRLDELGVAPGTSVEPESQGTDVVEIVPFEEMRRDDVFFDYMTQSNDELARLQTVYLDKYRVFAKNRNQITQEQGDLRARCLEYWRVPENVKRESQQENVNNAFLRLCRKADPFKWLPGGEAKCLLPKELDTFPFPGHHLHCIFNTDNLRFLLSSGASKIYTMSIFGPKSPSLSNRWELFNDMKNLRIPKDTVLLAETTQRLVGEGTARRAKNVVRVFDAACLLGDDISGLSLNQRRLAINKFCRSISRHTTDPNQVLVLLAESFPFKSLFEDSIFPRLSCKRDKGRRKIVVREAFGYEDEAKTPFYFTCGLVFLNPVKPPWQVCYSKSRNQDYYHNMRPRSDGQHDSIWTTDLSPDVFHDTFASFGETVAALRHWSYSRVEDAEVLLSGNKKEADEAKSPWTFPLLKVFARKGYK